MLLHVILLLSVHYSRAGKNLPEICNELSAVATGPGKYTEIVSRQSNVVCRESAAGIVVWSHWTSKRNAILRGRIFYDVPLFELSTVFSVHKCIDL